MSSRPICRRRRDRRLSGWYKISQAAKIFGLENVADGSLMAAIWRAVVGGAASAARHQQQTIGSMAWLAIADILQPGCVGVSGNGGQQAAAKQKTKIFGTRSGAFG